MVNRRVVAVPLDDDDLEGVGEAGQHVHLDVHGDGAGLRQRRSGTTSAEEREVFGGVVDHLAAPVGVGRRAERAAAGTGEVGDGRVPGDFVVGCVVDDVQAEPHSVAGGDVELDVVGAAGRGRIEDRRPLLAAVVFNRYLGAVAAVGGASGQRDGALDADGPGVGGEKAPDGVNAGAGVDQQVGDLVDDCIGEIGVERVEGDLKPIEELAGQRAVDEIRHTVVVKHVVEDGVAACLTRLDEVDAAVAVDVLKVAVAEGEPETATDLDGHDWVGLEVEVNAQIAGPPEAVDAGDGLGRAEPGVVILCAPGPIQVRAVHHCAAAHPDLVGEAVSVEVDQSADLIGLSAGDVEGSTERKELGRNDRVEPDVGATVGAGSPRRAECGSGRDVGPVGAALVAPLLERAEPDVLAGGGVGDVVEPGELVPGVLGAGTAAAVLTDTGQQRLVERAGLVLHGPALHELRQGAGRVELGRQVLDFDAAEQVTGHHRLTGAGVHGHVETRSLPGHVIVTQETHDIGGPVCRRGGEAEAGVGDLAQVQRHAEVVLSILTDRDAGELVVGEAHDVAADVLDVGEAPAVVTADTAGYPSRIGSEDGRRVPHAVAAGVGGATVPPVVAIGVGDLPAVGAGGVAVADDKVVVVLDLKDPVGARSGLADLELGADGVGEQSGAVEQVGL